MERIRIPQWEAGWLGNCEKSIQLEERCSSLYIPQCPHPSLPQAFLYLPEFASSWEFSPLNTLESLKDLIKSGELGKVGLF